MEARTPMTVLLKRAKSRAMSEKPAAMGLRTRASAGCHEVVCERRGSVRRSEAMTKKNGGVSAEIYLFRNVETYR